MIVDINQNMLMFTGHCKEPSKLLQQPPTLQGWSDRIQSLVVRDQAPPPNYT